MVDWSEEALSAPALGETLPAARGSRDALALLAKRRSTTADLLAAPGPDVETLAAMLRIAARAPDHRRVTPFRFIVIDAESAAALGAVLVEAFRAANPDEPPERAEKERGRLARAPVVVAVVSRVDLQHKTPEWEQILTAGAVCQNLLVAANAFGFAAQWLTEWCAYDARVLARLGLEETPTMRERIAGYLYIGSAQADPKERQRPDVAAITTHLSRRFS